jgi:RnfABCDGE-type electron transport complex B subunit
MSVITLSPFVLGLTGFVFAVILAFLSKKLKVEDDPRVAKILSILPGANCGACGFVGCRGFAEAVIKEGKIFSGCIPGGSKVNKDIVKILGLKVEILEDRLVSLCHCGADDKEKKVSFLYEGPKTCKAASVTGAIDCAYGCLGFGDCVKVCPTNAITLKNKKVSVDIKKCIGCGKCVKACPCNLFELVPFNISGLYVVACNNTEKAANVKKVCSRGCIACGICTKVKDSSFYLKDNLSRLGYSKPTNEESLREAQDKCPTKCIFKI